MFYSIFLRSNKEITPLNASKDTYLYSQVGRQSTSLIESIATLNCTYMLVVGKTNSASWSFQNESENQVF